MRQHSTHSCHTCASCCSCAAEPSSALRQVVQVWDSACSHMSEAIHLAGILLLSCTHLPGVEAELGQQAQLQGWHAPRQNARALR